MTDTPPGTDYRGPSGIARDSTWLTSEDLPHDKDTVVEIETVRLRKNLQMQGGRPKNIALSLKFKGKQRELMLNSTNRKMLARLCNTNECGGWFGKRITLFVEQGVRRPDGTTGPAVRIRAKLPPQDAKTEAPEPVTAPDDAAETEARRQEQA